MHRTFGKPQQKFASEWHFPGADYELMSTDSKTARTTPTQEIAMKIKTNVKAGKNAPSTATVTESVSFTYSSVHVSYTP
jgi:hypothetical protein